MQSVLTIGIVLAAAGYLAWMWAAKRKHAHAAQEEGSAACDSCSACSGCSGQ
ncbi:MAG: hypothetical protein IPK70_11595 [Flavobacteriales bacterium]|nr:hypothetical protein [Flavobacteriales bacterium]